MKNQLNPQMKNPNCVNSRGFEAANQTTTKGNATMTNIVPLGTPGVQTMSSREIAELTSKQHQHVKRDCETMFVELGLDASSFGRIYHDTMNRKQAEYLLTYELVQTLITGYSIKLRHAVIQRLNELEAKQAPTLNPANLSRLQLIEMAMQAEQERMALESKVVEMTPTVQAYDRIAKSDGSFCLLDTAKTLQVRPKDFMNWMQAHSWIYKRAGCAHWIGYQEKVQAGYLEHKTTTVTRGDGSEKIVEQVRVTAKGLTKLAKVFAKGEAA